LVTGSGPEGVALTAVIPHALLSLDRDELSRLLRDDGLRLVDRGSAPALLVALDRLGNDESTSSRALGLVRGACFLVTGAADEAITCLEPLMDGSAAVAWRLGAVHYLLGDPDAALVAFSRASTGDVDLSEQAKLASWTSTAHWARGEAESSGSAARRALELARHCRDESALAAAHISLALHAALVGDRCSNATHYGRALEYADRAGDVVQRARILANRSSRLVEEGQHAAALVEATSALEAARRAGFTVVIALSEGNRGLALLRLGRFDAALHAFGQARDAYQRVGSRRVADALCGLGDVHRERGDLLLAVASYEEALEVLGDSGDCQARVPVLAGLARVLWPANPGRARTLADEALGYPGSLDHPFAVATAGWVSLLSGDNAAAMLLAERAIELAGRRRNSQCFADALELTAFLASDDDQRIERLSQAAAARSAIGDVVGEARVQLVRARSSRGAAARRSARCATDVLARSGVQVDHTPGLGVLTPLSPLVEHTVIRCLGRFEVRRRGAPVLAPEWRSRKARDLLKLLAARLGRATAREQLMDVLWPDVDPSRLGNRFAGVLATVRRVLDPADDYPLDHFVVGDDGGLALDLDHLQLDIAMFFDDVIEARRASAAGRIDDARSILAEAVTWYRGDAFEEDPYADWAWSVREEARNAYAEAMHLLLTTYRRDGDHMAALAVARQLLTLDPYDETAHRACIELLSVSGRHGEAQRARAAYATRMGELGVDTCDDLYVHTDELRCSAVTRLAPAVND
jgi:two-component SAPR family response regulator